MSDKMYTRLLRLYRLYPSGFRKEYQDESLQLIRDRLRDETGFFKRARLGWDLIADALTGLPQAYLNSYAMPEAVSLSPHPNGIPSFKVLDQPPLSRSSILVGVTLSMFALVAFGFVLSRPIFYQSTTPANGRMSPIESVMQRVNQDLDPASLTASPRTDANSPSAQTRNPAATAATASNPSQSAPLAESPSRLGERAIPTQVPNPNGRSITSTTAQSAPSQAVMQRKVVVTATPVPNGLAVAVRGDSSIVPKYAPTPAPANQPGMQNWAATPTPVLLNIEGRTTLHVGQIAVLRLSSDQPYSVTSAGNAVVPLNVDPSEGVYSYRAIRAGNATLLISPTNRKNGECIDCVTRHSFITVVP
jgi:hypothetical protein